MRKEERMKRSRNKSVLAVIGMIAGYEPTYLFFSIAKILVGSAGSWLIVWFPKQFLEMLFDKETTYGMLLGRVCLFACMMMILWLAGIFLGENETRVSERFVQTMREEISRVSMHQPFQVIESGQYKEQLNMANNVSDVLKALGIAEAIVEGLVTAVSLAVLLCGYDLRVFLLVFAVLVVKTIFVRITVSYSNKRRVVYGKCDRVGNYLNHTGYMNPGAAKEIRIHNIREWFLSKIWRYRKEMLAHQYRDFKVYAMFDAFSAILMAVQTLVVVISLAVHTSNGDISIPEFTMYFTAVTTITAVLSDVIAKTGEIHRYKIYLGDFSELFATVEGNAGCVLDEHCDFEELQFENVSFRYPGTDQFVLKNISFTIHRGEKLSVVGFNGAGKSTLVKLICKFYKPTEGHIYLNGKDIWDIEDVSYRDCVSAVFQDYVNFAFSVRENITMGRENIDVMVNARYMGFEDSMNHLPQGLDTVVSRMFDDSGVDLSGGEQQRIAILRALCKDAMVTILDEPTCALDAKAEAELYTSFTRLMQDRTAILISHRLASSVIADKILVLINGEVNDYGTHDELMSHRGMYYDMYHKQSEAYG